MLVNSVTDSWITLYARRLLQEQGAPTPASTGKDLTDTVLMMEASPPKIDKYKIVLYGFQNSYSHV